MNSQKKSPQPDGFIRVVDRAGKVYIPAKMRKKFGIEPGAEVRFLDKGGFLLLQLAGGPVGEL